MFGAHLPSPPGGQVTLGGGRVGCWQITGYNSLSERRTVSYDCLSTDVEHSGARQEGDGSPRAPQVAGDPEVLSLMIGFSPHPLSHDYINQFS